jgi:hypothetical protein
MVICHLCDIHSTPEAEVKRSKLHGQHGLHNKTSAQKKENIDDVIKYLLSNMSDIVFHSQSMR